MKTRFAGALLNRRRNRMRHLTRSRAETGERDVSTQRFALERQGSAETQAKHSGEEE